MYRSVMTSGLLRTLRSKTAGQTFIPERLLGANLTQFDTESRIPASSLGSWENFQGLKGPSEQTKSFPDIDGISGRRYPGQGVRITELGCGARAAGPWALHRDPTENRAHAVSSGLTATTAQEAHQWQQAL